MHIVNIDHLTINHAGREIFRDRVGLVGPNGAGKSSLLKAITGEVAPFAGTINRPRTLRIGFLHQDITLESGQILLDTALILPPELARAESELAAIEAQLADPHVYEDEARLTRVLEHHEKVLAHYERLNGPRHASLVRELLASLGFGEADYDLPADTLSGGQKKLVRLSVSAGRS